MPEYQGTNADGEPYGSPYVEHDTSATSIDCSHDGKTRQEFAAECDINVLLAKYETTGVLNHYSRMEPLYMDLGDGVPDLATALAYLERAQEAFMTLNASARREFDNDPVKFVQFAENPDNLPRMREWGLAPPLPVEPAPVKVELTNPPPAPEASK